MAELEQVEQPIRLCEACAYSQGQGNTATCEHPQVKAAADPVSGTAPRLCKNERAVQTSILYPCGFQGALHEPKQPVTFTDHGAHPMPPIPAEDDDTGVTDWNARAEQQKE